MSTTLRVERAHQKDLPSKATPTSCATTTMAPTSSYAYGLRCYKCKQQGHLPRECPNLLCEVCKAKGHMAWQCTTPSAKMLYFDELQAQATKKPMAPTVQDEDRQGQRKGEVDPSLALNNTIVPSHGANLGGDGVEKVEHGISLQPRRRMELRMVSMGFSLHQWRRMEMRKSSLLLYA